MPSPAFRQSLSFCFMAANSDPSRWATLVSPEDHRIRPCPPRPRACPPPRRGHDAPRSSTGCRRTPRPSAARIRQSGARRTSPGPGIQDPWGGGFWGFQRLQLLFGQFDHGYLFSVILSQSRTSIHSGRWPRDFGSRCRERSAFLPRTGFNPSFSSLRSQTPQSSTRRRRTAGRWR